MSTLSGKRTDTLKESIYIGPNTLSKTEQIEIKVVGDFN